MSDDNPVFAELPGTEATVLYDEEVGGLYIRLKQAGGTVETKTLIASPLVNVDLYMGEAVGIEILLPKAAQPPVGKEPAEFFPARPYEEPDDESAS